MKSEGKIDEYGGLWIARAGKLKVAMCPYCWPEGGREQCSDWCPQFDEPELCEVETDDGIIETTAIRICGDHYLQFEVFEDERR